MQEEFTESVIPEADQYCKDALSGKIPLCKCVKLAGQRNQRDLRKAKKRFLWVGLMK